MAKSANKKSKLDFSNFLPSILILAFLCVGFIPNWGAVDKIAPQWLYLSVLNFLCGLFLFFNRKSFQEQFLVVLSSFISLSYIGFVLWAAFSYFYAINPTEALVNITRQFNTLFMFLHIGILLYNIKEKNRLLSLAIMAILSIEVYAVLVQALEMYKGGGIIPVQLKGVTANRNITAFSIAIKIPYLFYLIFRSPKLWAKIAYAFLVFLSIFSVSLIQSRASFIAVIMIGVLLLIWTSISFLKKRSFKELIPILYYLIPLILALIFNKNINSGNGSDALSRASTISISNTDDSIAKRLRYYEDVMTHFWSNPILGVGIGNWKLSSVHYDREDIDGYIVPYHAHSDFIQLAAELGIIGFLLYLGVFLIVVYFVFVILFRSELDRDNKFFVFLLITALGVYFIDANLNFPIARPQVLAPFTLTIALVLYYYHQATNKTVLTKKVNALILFPLFVILLMIPSINISHDIYQSHKGQLVLLTDFNSNKYSIPLNKVDYVTPDIPNITVTTIPMETIKARYYMNAKKYDKALDLLNKGTKANPYLFMSENLKAQVFLSQGKIDSANVNAKKAFYGLPKNALHATTYAQVLQFTRNIDEARKVFNELSKRSGPVIWKNFLIMFSQIASSDPDLATFSTQAVDLFPEDKELLSIKKSAIIGQTKINEAVIISQKGQDFFNRQMYIEAAIEFENASKIDFLEFAHFENAASAYYMAGDTQNALFFSDKVINQFQPKTGKSEYINGLVKLNINLTQQGCEMLQKSIDFGYSQAQLTYNKRCLFKD